MESGNAASTLNVPELVHGELLHVLDILRFQRDPICTIAENVSV